MKLPPGPPDQLTDLEGLGCSLSVYQIFTCIAALNLCLFLPQYMLLFINALEWC